MKKAAALAAAAAIAGAAAIATREPAPCFTRAKGRNGTVVTSVAVKPCVIERTCAPPKQPLKECLR